MRHEMKCQWCDLKRIWTRLQHEKVARWTLIVHVVYYGHAAIYEDGMHMLLSTACAVMLACELGSKSK